MHGLIKNNALSDAEYAELLNAVGSRLFAGDDPGQHESIMRATILDLAKRDACRGDFARIKELYPELAGVFDRMKTKPAKRVRRHSGLVYQQFARGVRADMIKEIRRILVELTGQKRPDPALVARVAGDILNCSPSSISEIIKRGRNSAGARRR
jgi:hypothetical protein